MESLKSKLFILFILMSLIPMFFTMASFYHVSIGVINEKVNNSSMATLEIVAKTLDNKISRIQNEIELVTNSYEFQKNINNINHSSTDGALWAAQKEMEVLLLNAFSTSNDITGIYLSTSSGVDLVFKNKYAIDMESFRQSRWYQGPQNNIGVLTNCGIVNIDNNQSALILGKVVRDYLDKSNLSIIASVHFAIDPKIFESFFNSNRISTLGTFLIFDSQNRLMTPSVRSYPNYVDIAYENLEIIHENNSGNIYINSNDENNTILLYYTSPVCGYKTIQLIPYSLYNDEISSVTHMTLLFAVSCVLIILVITYFVSKNISQPIQLLNHAMKTVETGHFDILLPTTRKDEIGQIFGRFNKMVIRLKNVFNKSLEDEKQKRQLEISALQYQINPHFLNNVLTSIRSLALLENAPQSSEMLNTLVGLLKSTIGHAGSLISISKEIENIHKFLYIQNVCHGNNIDYRIDICHEVTNYLIPNLLLQPVVENAIFHGIDPDTGCVSIDINASLQGDNILFTIQDNGPGIEKEKLTRILKEDCSDDAFNHIGLKNVDKRIRLNFGDEHGVHIDSSTLGTTVQILLPALNGYYNRDKKI